MDSIQKLGTINSVILNALNVRLPRTYIFTILIMRKMRVLLYVLNAM